MAHIFLIILMTGKLFNTVGINFIFFSVTNFENHDF
jgi:hypothetical protein